MKVIHAAFLLGFSDYYLPLTLDQQVFTERFFGPEGNTLEHSFIALDGEDPVGLILGGIRQFDGLKTMRCGGFCIAPDYRGRGISDKLFQLHSSAAIAEGCEQLFLEVLKVNSRAIRFYEKQGYQAVDTLEYYTGEASALPPLSIAPACTVEAISFGTLQAFRESLTDCHINWQCDPPFYATSTDSALLAALDEDHRQIALIAMSKQGQINLLWVDPLRRRQRLGLFMIAEAAARQHTEKLNVCLTGSAALGGYFQALGFGKLEVEQIEMHLPL
ncbi:GNAT family N-acetyltransferase [Paenibacillus sp. GCM10012306]|uniref:GNAT family N-acetyltransferase n=1 Tax=Paenibacillus sp. GCM10012306 TaxID=3317342 RepID=UPI00361E9C5E